MIGWRLVVDLEKARKHLPPGPGQLSLFGAKPSTPPAPPAPTHVEVREVAAHTRHTSHGDVAVAAHTTHVHATAAPLTPDPVVSHAADDDPFAKLFEPKTPEEEAAERAEAAREAAAEAQRPKTIGELRQAHPCRKCGGSGTLPHYHHVEGGGCFRCNGTGVEPGHGAAKTEALDPGRGTVQSRLAARRERARPAPRPETPPPPPRARDPREEWEDAMTEAATRGGLKIRHSSVGTAVGGGAIRVEGLNVRTGLDALRERLPNNAATRRKVDALVDQVAREVAAPRNEDPAAVRAEIEERAQNYGTRHAPVYKRLAVALSYYSVHAGGNSTPARELAEVRLFADHFPVEPKPLQKGAAMPGLPRPPGAGRRPAAPAPPPSPAFAPGPHGAVPPTPGQRVKFRHPATGEETEGHVHGQPGAVGATIVDGEGTTHRVPHGQYMHVADAGFGAPDDGSGPKPQASLVKLAARKHLELGPTAPLAIYATAALLSIGGVRTVHELQAQDVRIKDGCLYVDSDKLKTDDPAIVQMVSKLQHDNPRGPLFQVRGQPMTEQELTTYVRRFGMHHGGSGSPAPGAGAGPAAAGSTPPAAPPMGGDNAPPPKPLQKAEHPRVSKAIAKFVAEGIPQEQAVAKALAMERAGRLDDEGTYEHVEQDLRKASPAALVLPVTPPSKPLARWEQDGFVVEFRKGRDGIGLVTIDGPNLPVPLHEVAQNEASARAFAREAVAALQKGDAPRRGVFQVTR